MNHIKPEITIAIHTRNRPEFVLACLQSILNQSVLPTTLLLIENVREYKHFSKEMLDTYLRLKINCKYIQTTADCVAHSRNISLNESPGDLLIAVDDDVVFANKKIVENIVNVHVQNPNIVGFVGPILPSTSNAWSIYSSVLCSGKLIHSKGITLVKSYPSACYSLKIKQVKKSKIQFNTNLKTGEDIDFFWHITNKRLLVAFYSEIPVVVVFPKTFFSFIHKQYLYARSYANLAKLTENNFDGTNWFFPSRKIHVIFYPFFLIRQIWLYSLNTIKDGKLANTFLLIAIVHHISTIIGVSSTKLGRLMLIKAIKKL